MSHAGSIVVQTGKLAGEWMRDVKSLVFNYLQRRQRVVRRAF
jgi:hypothetical protein